MPASASQRSPQVKVDPRHTADDAADTVLEWVKVALLFLLMYALTIGYNQAAWFFGLPQASLTEVGRLRLFIRRVEFEVRRILKT
jgi:hypothetical protein